MKKPPPPDHKRAVLESPEAIVYTIPRSGARIVVAPDEKHGWIGICINPKDINRVSSWNTETILIPDWIVSKTVPQFMLTIANRIDVDGLASFHLNYQGTNVQVTAKWQAGKFIGGRIVSVATSQGQDWYNHDDVAIFYEGEELFSNPRIFNDKVMLKNFLKTLMRAYLLSDGGLQKKVPTY